MSWKWLATRWLRQQVQQEAFRAAEDALRKRAAQASEADDESAEQPAPTCDVAIVFAIGGEAGGVLDRMTDKSQFRASGFDTTIGKFDERRVAVGVGGIGQAAAAKVCDAIITAHRPRWIISAGYAGGLQASLARGEILLVDAVEDTEGNRFDLDLRLNRDEIEQQPGLHVGKLLTAGRLVARPEEKQALGERHDALAVDMETAAVARVCRNAGVPLVAVRAISDAVDERLPPEIEAWVSDKSLARKAGVMAGSLWKQPGRLQQMWQMRERTLVLGDRLADFLAGLIGQLPVEQQRPD